MLRWRLILGVLSIALLAALCWADSLVDRPGVFLAPLAVVLCLMATQEMLALLRAGGRTPVEWTVYVGTLLPVLASAVPILWKQYPTDCPIGRLGWLACGFAAGLVVAVLGEMIRYLQPGQTISNLGAAALSILYVGGMIGFLLQLRLMPAGMIALLSLIIIVKLSDTGQYFVGHRFGRQKLAPLLSPGKTREGAFGGIAFAVVVGSLVFSFLMNGKMGIMPSNLLPWMVYSLAISLAGIVGDLAESLLKRDAGVKDSSNWLPGFGGVLDLLDSLLLAAPLAYVCWIGGLLGP